MAKKSSKKVSTVQKVAERVSKAFAPGKESVDKKEASRGKKVRAKVRAIAMGQHAGVIIQPGEVFVFNGHLREVDGSFYFPRWIEAPKGYQNLDDVGRDPSEDSEEDELEEGEVIEDDGLEDVETNPKADRATRASRPTVKSDSKVKPMSEKDRAAEQAKIEQEAANNSADDLI